MDTDHDALRARLEGTEVHLDEAQWAALPRAARRRLLELPYATATDRQRLAAIADWMRSEFPPGWNRRG